jgi:serine/threonine-protein kinase
LAELATGTLVEGRYMVLSRLGSGGMADVFLAEDQQLGRKVALKLLHRRFAEDPGFVERFRREAQAAAGLQHPHVVGVYDRGAFDDTYFIAMEYLPGRSLKQLIRQEAPLDPVRAIDIAIQMLRAARFAHRRGVIHRDLKPHNVIVDDTGHAKVTDFGIARAGASDMTETGSIMGTAQYLSPEQAQGHPVSAGSDLYAIGVVLYEMLTGLVPFDAETAVTIALKHVAEQPRPPSSINPEVPPELDRIVLWAMNKNPADRPADADQFVSVLEQARAAIVARASGQRTASIAALAGAALPLSAPSVAVSDMGVYPLPEAVPAPLPLTNGDRGAAALSAPRGAPPRRRRIWPWLLAAVAVLALAVAGVAAYLHARPTKVVVANVVLEQVNVAQTRIQNADLTPNLVYRMDSQPSGTVIDQSPLAGAKVDQGATVTLTVSQGPGSTPVPSVDDLSQQAAVAAIGAAHLSVARTLREPSATIAAGRATGTDPAAGISLPVGDAVTLYISSGKPLVAIPDVGGEPEGAAKAALQTAGLTVQTSSQRSSTAQPDSVVSQSPAPGTMVPQGTTVTIVLAIKPPPPPPPVNPTITVPDVVGKSAGAASAQLRAAGFQVAQQTRSTSNRSEGGVVQQESPGAGATESKNSTVTIIVGKYVAPKRTKTTQTTKTTSSSSSTSSTSASSTTTPQTTTTGSTTSSTSTQ